MMAEESRIQNDADPAATAETANRPVEEIQDWRERVPTSIAKPLWFGVAVVGLFFAGFGYWATQAPIAGAAVAPGIVIASGQNQNIDHLEGGIIAEIAAREGEKVSQGQALVYLDPTQAAANRNRVNKSIVALAASLARSTAEMNGEQDITFPDDVLERARQSSSEESLELQRSQFFSRLKQHQSELTVLDEQVRAIEEEMAGIELQIEAEKTKLVVIRDELEAKEKLLKRGLTPKNQYNALLRSEADAVGAVGGLTATIGQRKKSIAEVRERQETLRAARRSEASSQINDLRQQINDLDEQLTSRSDILERMIIRAPVDGVIVNIAKNTIGSIIRPGETVLELLPTSDDLIISARVSPVDVDIVTIGQEASIRFSALNARTTPEVPATVQYISADRLIDEATQEPYFAARLKLVEDLPSGFDPAKIYPGMPVDTFIKTGDRTFVEYLAKPITDSFRGAFTEE